MGQKVTSIYEPQTKNARDYHQALLVNCPWRNPCPSTLNLKKNLYQFFSRPVIEKEGSFASQCINEPQITQPEDFLLWQSDIDRKLETKISQRELHLKTTTEFA